MPYAIEAKNLRKTYKLSKKQQKINHTDAKTKIAVDNLSFSVRQGEIYGLLGPNGAGKTTTLRMLAGLIRPDSGDAFIDTISVVNNPDKARARIGFLTSDLKMEDIFSPTYLFNFFAALHNTPEDIVDKRRDKLFNRFDINNFAETKIGDLSTGMKQKVSLAVAIAHDPDVVIFDEPTNGLDIITAKTVTDFLFDLREEGKTVILSTHIFSLVEKVCDSVGIILDGRMILEDECASLTANSTLENVFFDVYEATKGEEK